MALGYAVRRRGSFGDLNYRIVDVTLDGAYAAGGYTLVPKDMGFGTNGVLVFVIPSPSADGFLTEFDEATSKLKIRDSSGGVGAATPEAATNLAALTGIVVRMMAMGVGHG
jgi:hypothetical protein